MTRYAPYLIIVLLANQAAIATAAAGEQIISRDPATIVGQKRSGQQATQDARMTLVKPLDRVASAVDGAESSHGKDIAMWRPDPSGPQGPMQVSEAAATDVGGGDRFDLTQNRALGRAYLAQLYGRYKNWPDAIAAYNWGPAISIPGSKPDDRSINCWLVWRPTPRGSYTIVVFATASRLYRFSDRWDLTATLSSA